MTPSRRAATSDFSIQSSRASSSRTSGLDARLRRALGAAAGLGQCDGAEQDQAAGGQGGDRFRDRSWQNEPPRLQGYCRADARLREPTTTFRIQPTSAIDDEQIELSAGTASGTGPTRRRPGSACGAGRRPGWSVRSRPGRGPRHPGRISLMLLRARKSCRTAVAEADRHLDDVRFLYCSDSATSRRSGRSGST